MLKSIKILGFFTLFITARLTFGPPAAFGTASKGLLIFGPLMDVAVVTGLPEIEEKNAYVHRY